MDAYQLADAFSRQTNRCIFITGKAGTGKTTFLRQLRLHTSKNMAVVAPTGVAAINAGGVTIHSFFQLPIRIIPPTRESHRQVMAEARMREAKRSMLYHLELLVIDEISMVRADILDAIDAILRRYRYKPNLPFGGVQVICIGDLFQLSPVVRNEEEAILSKYYSSPYFFSSHVMQLLQPAYIELDHVFRQQNTDFINLLNEVRNNHLSAESRAMLNSRYIPDFKDESYIILTTHNQTADEVNSRRLSALKTPEHTFKATITGQFPESNYPADIDLKLKVGAQVMFIRNDDSPEKRFYNGKMGKVKEINDEGIVVKCEGEQEIQVERLEWTNIRYIEDEATGKIEEEELGSFVQYPLRLAWAITIHKSQGLTFDKVLIDAARAFASGQVYVALSRCRTLEGIVLSTRLDNVYLSNDQQVIDYTNSQPDISHTELQLDGAKREYLSYLLTDIYSYEGCMGQVLRLREIASQAVSFNKETIEFLDVLSEDISDLQAVGGKFCKQIASLVSQNDQDMLQERLKASVGYFQPRLHNIVKTIDNTTSRSKNKDDAADFLKVLTDLRLNLLTKENLVKNIADEPTIENVLSYKNKYIASVFPIKSLLDKIVKGQKPAKKEMKEKKAEAMLQEIMKKKSVPQKTVSDFSMTDLIKRLEGAGLVLTEEQKTEVARIFPRDEKELAALRSFRQPIDKETGQKITEVVNKYIEDLGIQQLVEFFWKRAKYRS